MNGSYYDDKPLDTIIHDARQGNEEAMSTHIDVLQSQLSAALSAKEKAEAELTAAREDAREMRNIQEREVEAIVQSLYRWMADQRYGSDALLHAAVCCDFSGMVAFKGAMVKQILAALARAREEGNTCGACFHREKCKALICTLTDESRCDFSPSRWRAREEGNTTEEHNREAVK